MSEITELVASKLVKKGSFTSHDIDILQRHAAGQLIPFVKETGTFEVSFSEVEREDNKYHNDYERYIIRIKVKKIGE